MSSRVSRSSRSRRIDFKNAKVDRISGAEIQPKVTAFFPTVRRGKSAGKRMKVEVPASVTVLKSELSDSVLDSVDTAIIPYDFSKLATQTSTDAVVNSNTFNSIPEKSLDSEVSLVNTSDEVSSGKKISSEGLVSNTQEHRKPAKRRLLFSNEERSITGVLPKEDVDNDINFIKSRIICRGSSSKTRKAKTVSELQDRLASSGVGLNLHKQNLDYRSSKVARGESILLSPKKMMLLPLKSIKVLPTPRKVSSKVNEDLDSFSDDCKKGRRDWLNYGRASLLKPEVKNSAGLNLPKKFEHLLRLFENTERVISMYQARDMRTPLELVMRNVISASKCAFTIKHFAQIVFIYPVAYKIRVEECKARGYGFEGRFEYIIEANLEDDLQDFMERDVSVNKDNVHIPPPPFTSPTKGRVVGSPRKTPVKVAPLPRAPLLDLRTRLETWRLVVRAAIFKHLLVEFMRKNNSELFDKLETSMNSENGKYLTGCSDLDDTLFKDIPEGTLPELPKGDGSLCKNMRDYLRGVDDSYNTLPSKVQGAIDLLRSPDGKAAFVNGRTVPLSPSKYASSVPEKPRTLSILERIRAKDVERKRLEALRDPEKELKRASLQELLVYIRDLCRLFTFKKVGSMLLSDLIEKMRDGSARSSNREIETQIILLTEVAKDFVELKEIRGQKYILLKQNSSCEIVKVINEELKKCA